MMYKTHIAYGCLITLLVFNFFKVSDPILFFLIVLFGTLLPDLDNTNSVIGRKIKPFSYFFRHRGFFHSLFAVFFFIVLFRVLSASDIMIFGFILGYTSHIVMDAMTVRGITPFFPIINYRVKGFIKTSSLSELVVFFFMMVFIVIDVYYKMFLVAF